MTSMKDKLKIAFFLFVFPYFFNLACSSSTPETSSVTTGGGSGGSTPGGGGTGGNGGDGGDGEGGGGNGGGGGSNPDTQTTRFRISNQCSYPIWIQQNNMPNGNPAVVRLSSGEHVDYDIPEAGLPATRFWPKAGCDNDGNNCVMGQSSPPCPLQGCAPPVDSKMEVTWGCTLSDQSQCAFTDQGQQLGNTTYYNSSAVDGYTFPYRVTVSANGGDACNDLDCSDLLINECPTNTNLSQGFNLISPQYGSVDLRVMNLSLSSGALGCYSPCKKFNYPTYGGFGLSESSDEAVLYCCPTPPIGPEECRGGPADTMAYTELIHQKCTGGVYGYAYDDGVGLHSCTSSTQIEMVVGPNCP